MLVEVGKETAQKDKDKENGRVGSRRVAKKMQERETCGSAEAHLRDQTERNEDGTAVER